MEKEDLCELCREAGRDFFGDHVHGGNKVDSKTAEGRLRKNLSQVYAKLQVLDGRLEILGFADLEIPDAVWSATEGQAEAVLSVRAEINKTGNSGGRAGSSSSSCSSSSSGNTMPMVKQDQHGYGY